MEYSMEWNMRMLFSNSYDIFHLISCMLGIVLDSFKEVE